MAKVAGKDFAVYADGVKIGDARDCSLNLNHALLTSTSKDDANWEARLPGMRDWSIDVNLVYDESNSFAPDDALDLIINATLVQVEFSQGTNGSTYWYGNAYLSPASISAPMTDVTTASLTFLSDGALSKGSISGS